LACRPPFTSEMRSYACTVPRVRVTINLTVLPAETPTVNVNSIMVQYDGEAKPRKFNCPPATVERPEQIYYWGCR
jgi:hypothetical protein